VEVSIDDPQISITQASVHSYLNKKLAFQLLNFNVIIIQL